MAPDIELSTQYADEKKVVNVNISYGGGAFDPFAANGGDLGVMLIRGLCRGKDYEYSKGKNMLTLILK